MDCINSQSLLKSLGRVQNLSIALEKYARVLQLPPLYIANFSLSSEQFL
jgi:hypothetical protein